MGFNESIAFTEMEHAQEEYKRHDTCSAACPHPGDGRYNEQDQKGNYKGSPSSKIKIGSEKLLNEAIDIEHYRALGNEEIAIRQFTPEDTVTLVEIDPNIDDYSMVKNEKDTCERQYRFIR